VSAITLDQATAHRDAWLAADLAVAQNQAYTVQGRSFTKAHAAEIRANLDYWERRVVELSRGPSRGPRVRYGVTD